MSKKRSIRKKSVNKGKKINVKKGKKSAKSVKKVKKVKKSVKKGNSTKSLVVKRSLSKKKIKKPVRKGKTTPVKTMKKGKAPKITVKKDQIKKPIQEKRVIINPEEKKKMVGLFSDAYARQVLISLGGENALEIIRNYPHESSDEEIARKLKVKISDIRATLNRMHGEGFVIYTRKKDSETGWYSYSWSLNKKNIFEWAKKINNEKHSLFSSDLEKYYCRKCGFDSLVGFVEASNRNFKCSCCNGSLDFLENEKAQEIFGKVMPEQIKRRRLE